MELLLTVLLSVSAFLTSDLQHLTSDFGRCTAELPAPDNHSGESGSPHSTRFRFPTSFGRVEYDNSFEAGCTILV